MPETTPIPVLRWRCDIARPAPRALQIYRGETARLECLLTLQGDPATIPADATALIAWQSRDMGASWYTAEASVDVSRGAVLADFTPAMDSGAAEFRAFLRVDGGEGSGICYRAAALLQMLDSPGAVINEIPIPPRVLDFATIEVLNAPYYTKSDADARFASVADATLNGRGLSEWAYAGVPDGGVVSSIRDPTEDAPWILILQLDGQIYQIFGSTDDPSATTVLFEEPDVASITATRSALPGYVLGSQTEKPIPKLSDVPAVVAPSTSAADAGKAADAKATGDALAGKLAKSGGTMTGPLTAPNFYATSSNGFAIDLGGGAVTTFEHLGIITVTEQDGANTIVVFIPGTVAAASNPARTLTLRSDLPSSETWTFEVDDGQGGTETMTKSVAVFAAAQAAQGGTP